MKRITTILTIALIIALISPLGAFSDNFYPAKVKDISDRAYEPAAIDILDNAKESIVISMYILNPSDKGPISFLMKDLTEALDRGVSVTIYLNTKFNFANNAPKFTDKPFKKLISKGAKIYPINTKHMLHDKLIIVDERYIIEGSTNWSVVALKKNFESSSLIDSPQLARVKLDRLKKLPLEAERVASEERLALFKKPSTYRDIKTVRVNSRLLDNKDLFPHMVTKHASQVMDTYLILLKKKESLPPHLASGPIPVFPEDFSRELGISTGSTNKYKREAVSEALRKLERKYGLIDLTLKTGREAWVTLLPLKGKTFPVDKSFFDPAYLAKTRTRVKFVYLIEALLKSEGTSLGDFTIKDLSRRFGVTPGTLRAGMGEE